MKIKQIICYLLYYSIAFYLPKSNSKISFGSKKREILVKGFIKYGGKNINIQRRAIISRKISIGDYTGIGEGSLIQTGVTIGNQ